MGITQPSSVRTAAWPGVLEDRQQARTGQEHSATVQLLGPQKGTAVEWQMTLQVVSASSTEHIFFTSEGRGIDGEEEERGGGVKHPRFPAFTCRKRAPRS